MQSNMQNISPIKQRILQFVANLGISKREFYSLTGIWIFTGKGEKFQSQQDEIPTYFAPEQNIEDKLLCIIAKKDSEIRELAEEVGKLKQEILQLKNSI